MAGRRLPKPVPPELGWPSTESWGRAFQHYAHRMDEYTDELERRAKALCDEAEVLANAGYEPTFRAHQKLVVSQAVKALRELLEGK